MEFTRMIEKYVKFRKRQSRNGDYNEKNTVCI